MMTAHSLSRAAVNGLDDDAREREAAVGVAIRIDADDEVDLVCEHTSASPS